MTSASDPVPRGAATATAAAPRPVVPHSRLENVVGILTGAFVVSLGIALLKQSHLVTGGTAGLALLASYVAPLPFGAVYVLVNLPFFALAIRTKGWRFTLRSIASVALVSAFSLLHHDALAGLHLNPLYATVTGNLLAGIGMIVLFRHGSSLGGFNVLALLAQERFALRAGYVQMGLDVAVVLTAFAVVAPLDALVSAAGAVVVNLVLAMNHRPGRYAAA